MGSLNVLVVDDSRTNAYVVTKMLIELDHNVIAARDAEEALTLLREHPQIQVLIVDWVLPTMQGPDLAQVVRKEFSEPYRYIIMVTAKSGRTNMLVGLQSGIDDYMEKPVEVAELNARLKIAARILNLESDLKHQLEKTEKVHREWEATTNAVSQLICLVSADGTVLQTNSIVEAWRLLPRTEAVDLPLTDMLARRYPDLAEQFRRIWDEMVNTLHQHQMVEFEAADPTSGSYFTVQVQPIQQVSTANGTRSSFAAVNIQDITERKSLEIKLNKANTRTEELLLNILPAPIADRLRGGEHTIAESYESVTVMFADLVGFTRLTSSISPRQLMDMLNAVFTAFDDLTEKYDVEKIKTIGDAYLVVGGLPTPRPDHAEAIANMALEMQQAMTQLSQSSGYPLSLRIGMDTGPVVAGVIGNKKFAYDLWGDTVNTAARMESNGIGGGIQVSERTYKRLKADYQFEARGEIEIKGKGKMPAFLLQGR